MDSRTNHSDQGSYFEPKMIQSLCSLIGLKKSLTTQFHPMGNGMVERFIRTLLNMLGTMLQNYISSLTLCLICIPSVRGVLNKTLTGHN